jgi:hypothetical protein
MRTFRIIALALSLVGCTTAYVQPPAESSATLTLTNASKTSGVAFLAYGSSESCKISELTSLSQLHSPDREVRAGESMTVRIPGGLPFTVDAGTGNPTSRSCEVIATFMPIRGKSYVATFEDAESRCFLSVRRIEDGVPLREPSVKQREKVAGIANGMNACR